MFLWGKGTSTSWGLWKYKVEIPGGLWKYKVNFGMVTEPQGLLELEISTYRHF